MKVFAFIVLLSLAYVQGDYLYLRAGWPSFEKFSSVEGNGYLNISCTMTQAGYCLLESVEILQEITEESGITMNYTIYEYMSWRSIGRVLYKRPDVSFCQSGDDRDEGQNILGVIRRGMKLDVNGCPVPAQSNRVKTGQFWSGRIYTKLIIYKCQDYIIKFDFKNSDETIASGHIVLYNDGSYCPSYRRVDW